MHKKKLADSIKIVLKEIGEDPNREGLLKTPERVAKSMDYLTNGYGINPSEILKKAMFKVVNENKGTAFKSRLQDIKFAGKTGTSQVRRISLSERESDDFREKEQEWKNRDHALFVGYMPYDDPKYSISVIIEHGGSGASTAAPIAKQIFNYINELEV